jgi:hypothetical protein
MQKKAVGFYWTLPVPWVSFTKIDKDIEVAARQSKTIAYQRAVIHDFARNNHLRIVHEAAFLEMEPDRGSEHLVKSLKKAAIICREHQAILLLVDFQQLKNWRSHIFLDEWLGSAGLEYETIYPDQTILDGKLFNPAEHFTQWRLRQREWVDGKEDRAEKARARGLELRTLGMKNPAIAASLNAEGLKSPSGKDWTAENVRKFLADRAK